MKAIKAVSVGIILILTAAALSAAVISVPGDYTTIQSAINAASSGDTIQVGLGSYAESPTIDKCLVLLGARSGVDPAGSTNRGSETTITGQLTVSATADGTVVNGVRLVGGRLYINGADNVYAGYNVIVDADYHGVYIEPSSPNTQIVYSTVSHPNWDGIVNVGNDGVIIAHNHITGVTDQRVIESSNHTGAGIEITYNVISGSTGNKGINYWGGPNVLIAHNQIYGTEHEAIYTDTRATIEYNVINTCGYGGIILADYNGNDTASIVRGNQIAYASGAGILAHNHVAPITISGNDISDCETGGIMIYKAAPADDSQKSTIVGNTIYMTKTEGIAVHGRAYTLISGNVLSNCNYDGDWDYATIHVGPYGGENADSCTIVDNVVTDGVNGIQTWSDYVVISGNEIHDMGQSYPETANQGGRDYVNAGIVVGSNWGVDDYDPVGVVVTGNAVYDNYWGLYHSADLINGVTAEANYWGAVDGPDTEGKGGNAVSENVDYSPWWGRDYLNNAHVSPWLWGTDDSIQDAVVMASSGDTIAVSPGTYTGDVMIGDYWDTSVWPFVLNTDPVAPDKILHVRGAHADFDPAGSTDRGDESLIVGQVMVNSNGSGVSLNGFKLDGSVVTPGRSTIHVARGPNVVVSNNIIVNATAKGIGIGFYAGLDAPDAQILYNTVADPGAQGICNSQNTGVTISGNHVTGVPATEPCIESNNHTGTDITITGNVTVGGNKGISYWGGNDAVISGNDVSGTDGINGFAIFTDARASITGNTVTDCMDGIRADYPGTGPGDRVEIIGNNISYVKYAGINVTGSSAYVYGNSVDNCNYFGSDGLGDWDYASIHLEASAVNCIIMDNTVSDGVNGIQAWADGVLITGNDIYDMGVTYGEEKDVGGRIYKNSAILVGSNWGSSDYDPTGLAIGHNKIHNNYWGLFYSADLTNGVDAAENWWGMLSGPNHATNPLGTGDPVSDNVTFEPWCNETFSNCEFTIQAATEVWVDDDYYDGGANDGHTWGYDAFAVIDDGVTAVADGGTVYVAAGTYHNDIHWLTKLVSLYGPQAGVDPAGSTDRGGEAVLTRDDGSAFWVQPEAAGAIINGFKFGNETSGTGRRIYLNNAADVQISYCIILNSTGHGVAVGEAADRALIQCNTVGNSDWESIVNFGADDVSIVGNYIVDQFDSWPILVSGKSEVLNNTVINCYNGIRIDYAGTGKGNGVLVSGNSVSFTSYAGISVTGAYTHVYGNMLDHCNYYGSDGTGDWDYASIHLESSAVGCVIEANTVSDGINGIQTWADDVSIINNFIHDMGFTYADEKTVGGRIYKNSAILVGSNWGIGDFDPVGVTVFGNSMVGNYWNLFYSVDLAGEVDASGNWWGSATAGGVTSKIHDNIDYTPWLINGADSDPVAPGFQGSFADLWVDDDGPQIGGVGRIQEGVDMIATSGGTVNVKNGTYPGTINVENRENVTIYGESKNTVIHPSFVLGWNVGGYGITRVTGIRVVNSTAVALKRLRFNFDLIKGNDVSGILYWNASGEISGNTLANMSIPDASGGYRELTCYIRAENPEYDDANRAHVDILNNIFRNTGRLGVVAHDFVDLRIECNDFNNDDDDFGYGVEIGSSATAVIRDNDFAHFDTYASDQSVAAAILIENAYTTGQGPYSKPVTIEYNSISLCQYGIYVGNSHQGLSGDVDIIAEINDNDIRDNATMGSYSSGGLVLIDEGRDVGSSVSASLVNNTIDNNGDYGIYIATSGNGEISAFLTQNTILDNYQGIVVKEYSGPGNSAYNLTIHHNMFDNYLNAEDDVVGGYWDNGSSEGNCWGDFDGEIGDPYPIFGSAGTVDRYPNINCGPGCDCVPGDANNDEKFNLLDILYVIDYLYATPAGPPPTPYDTCSGDPNCDCAVNLIDILLLIEHIYQEPEGEPALCNCASWFVNCNLPIRMNHNSSQASPPVERSVVTSSPLKAETFR
ncbi:MAG: right-handed parallel beta-helix repeat-containing protein [candidate division Zixibacteria bacterium]|nr:right-handed parallel beta-helix repeat-containing protein [candidate division Zixibacteria bacterium]